MTDAREAAYYTREADGAVRCGLCPHGCRIAEGKRGRCGVRENRGGTLLALTYGRVASVSVDPMEKKPLYHVMPGADILSLGSWGCNFTCTFCQNHEISQHEVPTRWFPPTEVAAQAVRGGCCGVAYTYNEPWIAFEYVRDCAEAVRAAGLKNVMVSNGFCTPEPLDGLLPWIDAWNIDLKSGSEDVYRRVCGGALQPVLETLERVSNAAHLEVTTLLVPGMNDDPEEWRFLAQWVAGHCGVDTPVHLSAYTPRYRHTAPPTPVPLLEAMLGVFRDALRYVYAGNLHLPGGGDTVCPGCGACVIRRSGYRTDRGGLTETGACAACGTAIPGLWG